MSERAKVVVIDDTTEILDLIEVVLSEEGFDVAPCQDASRALDTVAAERPALVIADLRMAGVHSWELVDALLTDPRTRRTPVLVCSGAAAELRAEEARLTGLGADVLVKPFDIETLVGKVHGLIGRAEAGGSPA